jgi:hypothetical protein
MEVWQLIQTNSSTNINYKQIGTSDINEINTSDTTNDQTCLIELMKNGFSIILQQDEPQTFEP